MGLTTLDLAKKLIAKPSVTPDDQGCCELLAHELQAHGFTVKWYNKENVTNLYAYHGSLGTNLCLVGHTDVVPTGEESLWLHPPFEPTEVGDALYGRGACDMKGSLAALVISACDFVTKHPNHNGILSLLITSDEEGKALYGTRYVAKELHDEGITLDYALVGEPSSDQRLGDLVKIGRRGSLTGHLTLQGVQGHVAYPQLAHNPIHDALQVLSTLLTMKFDDGHPDFPPTSLQFSNIHAGTGADNVIPSHLKAVFNLRYNPSAHFETIQSSIEAFLNSTGLDFELTWHHSGSPFITPKDSKLIQAMTEVCQQNELPKPEWSTVGGTSDGRFLAPYGTHVIELGPVNKTIHQINEWVSIQELLLLEKLYLGVITEVLK